MTAKIIREFHDYYLTIPDKTNPHSRWMFSDIGEATIFYEGEEELLQDWLSKANLSRNFHCEIIDCPKMFDVTVQWSMHGKYRVVADSPEEAMKKATELRPLPKEPSFVHGSLKVFHDKVEEVK